MAGGGGGKGLVAGDSDIPIRGCGPRVRSMRCLAVLFLAVAPLAAHTAWKPASAEVVVGEGRVTVELRLDLPALLVGKVPADAQDAEMDVALADDARLAEALGRLAGEWPSRIRIEADGRRLALRVVEAPEVARIRAEQARLKIGEAYPLMQLVRLEGPWPGDVRSLRVGADDVLGPVVLRLRPEPGRMDFIQLPAGGDSGEIELRGPPPGLLATAGGFFARGFGHVLPDGWDHALFMLTLFLGAQGVRQALARSVAFTLGHTSTIALVWLGWMAVPGAWIEPLIALSIAVAAGVVAAGRVVPGGAAMGWALGFGLLHGLGFAAVAEMPESGGVSVLGALLGFNFGVEAAQLAVILAAAAVLYPLRGFAWFEGRVRRPLAGLAAAGGLALLASRI